MTKDVETSLEQHQEFLFQMKQNLEAINDIGDASEYTNQDRWLIGDSIRLFEKLLEHSHSLMQKCIVHGGQSKRSAGQIKFGGAVRQLISANVISEPAGDTLISLWQLRNEITHEYSTEMNEQILSRCPELIEAMENLRQSILVWLGR